MAIGIGIGMGISGAQQSAQLATGWFAIDSACAFSKPSNAYTEYLDSVPYKSGDYIQTRIAGPYAGKRILLGALIPPEDGEPTPATFVAIQGGSLAYSACQV